MPDNLAQFSARMRIHASRINEGATEAVRAAAGAIAEEVVSSTPVDTGRAISNWQAWLGASRDPGYVQAAVPGKKGSTRDASIAEALARLMQVVNSYVAGRSGSVNIANGAPYIGKLNAGSSTQAPAGFIEAAILRGRAAIRNVRIVR